MDAGLQPRKTYRIPNKVVRKIQKFLRHTTEDTFRLICQRQLWTKPINQKEFRLIGLRRAGNHAVAEWIKAQSRGKVEHLNNLAVGCNPYRYKYEQLINFHPEHTNWAEKHYKPLSQGQFVALDQLLCGYEDHDLKAISSPIFEWMHNAYLGQSEKRFDILIMRDPFNFLASRLKSQMVDVKPKSLTVVELWIQYAREFLNETTYLKHNKICINYNLWFTNLAYRQKLADRLGTNFTDAGIERVVSLGGGSSFDGKSMNGAASKMAVLDRWKHFMDRPDYRRMLQNQQLLEYSRKIFGDIPGTEVFF